MKNLSDINIEKSRSGVYKDNSENRRLHRVGQRYGNSEKGNEERIINGKDSTPKNGVYLYPVRKDGSKSAKPSFYKFYGNEKTAEDVIARLEELNPGKKFVKEEREDGVKEGKFSRVNLPDIPNAHKVNLTKYLSAKRKKAVDDAWEKAKFDSLPREKASVFQEGYNKLREQFNKNFDDMSKSERAELLYKILKMKNAMEKKS